MNDTTSGDHRPDDPNRRRSTGEPVRHFLQQADELRRAGKPQEATEILREGLQKNPDHVSAKVSLGRCLLDLGENREARTLLVDVIDQDATQMVASKMLVEAHLRCGDPAKARRQLDLYRILNLSDPEIDDLERRIELQTAGSKSDSPEQEALGETISELPSSHPAAREVGGGEPETNGRVPTVRTLTVAGPTEPFGNLGSAAAHELFLRGLAYEGLFPIAEEEFRGFQEDPLAEDEAVDLEDQTVTDLGQASLDESETGEIVVEGDDNQLLSLDELEESPIHSEPVAEAMPVAAEEEVLEEPVAQASVPKTPEVSETPEVQDDGAAVTATLGELYLRQGHFDEAASIFETVLGTEPKNAVALAGLAEAKSALKGKTASVEHVLLEGFSGQGTVQDKKIFGLNRYLSILRRAADKVGGSADVS